MKVTFGTSGACLFIKNKRSETLESNKEEFEMTFVNNEKDKYIVLPWAAVVWINWDIL